MRVNESDGVFQEWLLKLGDGDLGEDIIIPTEMRSYGDLIDTIFHDAWTAISDFQQDPEKETPQAVVR